MNFAFQVAIIFNAHVIKIQRPPYRKRVNNGRQKISRMSITVMMILRYKIDYNMCVIEVTETSLSLKFVMNYGYTAIILFSQKLFTVLFTVCAITSREWKGIITECFMRCG